MCYLWSYLVIRTNCIQNMKMFCHYLSIFSTHIFFRRMYRFLCWDFSALMNYNSFMIVWLCIVTDSLWIKPTDAPNSNFIGFTTLHVSGILYAHNQEFLAVHRLRYILCSCDGRLLPGVGWDCSSILLLVANGHHNCIKCTKADVRLRTLDDGQKACPKHVES